MKNFFEKHTTLAKGKPCMNCGYRLWGHASEIAHILPKQVFKSVAEEDDGVVYLCSNFTRGYDGCHDKYDRTWADAKSMSVWPLVKERYELIKDKITESNSKILNHFES